MATEYKTPCMSQAEIEGDKMVRDIVCALNLPSDQVRVTSYDHCKTLEELATAAGVDIADVQAAIQSAHREEMRAQIKQAVTDGTMTQDKADWLLEGLDKGYLDGGPGFGLGFGRGGHGGPNGKGQPPAQSTPTTSQ